MLLVLPLICILIKITLQQCTNGADGCLSCADPTDCDICGLGYYPFTIGGVVVCRLCFNTCDLCEVDNVCTTCAPTYTRQPGGTSCVLCSVTGCSSCSATNDCDICQNGYTRNLNAAGTEY